MNQHSQNIKSPSQACDAILNAQRQGGRYAMIKAQRASNKAHIAQMRGYMKGMDAETLARAERTIAGLESA